MARGSVSKQNVINKLLEVFPGSFVTAEGKEMRIPMTEDGSAIEIKVALTAAKDLIGGANVPTMKAEDVDSNFPLPVGTKVVAEVTDEEKANIQKLMTELGL